MAMNMNRRNFLAAAGLSAASLVPGEPTLFDRIKREVIGRGLDAPSARNHDYPDRLASFITDTLGESIWSKQKAICDAVDDHRFVAVASCHAAGKSHISSRIALAYLHTHPRSIVVTTAPTNRQVKNVLWRYINTTAARNSEKLLGRALSMGYEIESDWYAIGFKGATENTDAFQGFHAENILLIVDEAAGVPEPVFDAMDAILTGAGASLLLIGNPTSPSGTFRRAFHGDRDLFHTIKISAYDTPNFTHFGITKDDMLSGAWEEKVAGRPMPYPALIDPSWVARQIRRHGADSNFVISRIDADFPDDADDTLFSLAQLEAVNAAAGDLDDQREGHEYEVGIDVARFGSDESSMTVMQGPVYLRQWSWSKTDTMATVGKIERRLHEIGVTKHNSRLKVDVVGLGAGVADRLKEKGWHVIEINAGSASSDRENWRNFRDEMYWQLYERLREGRFAPAKGRQLDEIAMTQLTNIKYKYVSTYKMPVIESKDEAKRRGVPSPDRAESIIIACCEPPRSGVAPGVVKFRRQKGRW